MWRLDEIVTWLAKDHAAVAEEFGASWAKMMLEPTFELLDRLMVRDYFTQSSEVS